MSGAPRVYSQGWEDYELIDAGGGKKLERFGEVILIRPEVNAYFHSGHSFEEWRKQAHWEFVDGRGQTGNWKPLKNGAPGNWTMKYRNLKFHLELTKFKHIGLFPEQRVNWDEMRNHLNDSSSCVNLFAYTGAMSLAARSAGSEVIHVDSVKQLITWASKNMELSKLMNIKWVHDDALKFAKRLVRRGNKFDGIIMDPPAWGIGAKKEKWKLEEKLDELISNASRVLSADGILILNTYSPKVDVALIQEMSRLYLAERNWEVNELWMKTTTGKELYYGNRLLVKN